MDRMHLKRGYCNTPSQAYLGLAIIVLCSDHVLPEGKSGPGHSAVGLNGKRYRIRTFIDVLRWYSYNEALETLKMELPFNIAPEDPNDPQMVLSHTGKFRSDLTGRHQSSHEANDGVKHRIESTAMEPTLRGGYESLDL
ncbi:hypothetical protein FGADI_4359 [Fusarium gaditjirri]|uniref:Uncharacterized protein n=1 Tax=Fusarium gaditjirri TaxID=282569 RepID=A0A8H4WZP9_9HYPO|nr:hypothetical protein FGADI_4359 [Fusarium gaditjirri]